MNRKPLWMAVCAVIFVLRLHAHRHRSCSGNECVRRRCRLGPDANRPDRRRERTHHRCRRSDGLCSRAAGTCHSWRRPVPIPRPVGCTVRWLSRGVAAAVRRQWRYRRAHDVGALLFTATGRVAPRPARWSARASTWPALSPDRSAARVAHVHRGSNEADACQAVRDTKTLGAQFVKVYARDLPRDVYLAIADEARQQEPARSLDTCRAPSAPVKHPTRASARSNT